MRKSARIAAFIAILLPNCCLWPSIPDGGWHIANPGFMATTQFELPRVPVSESKQYVWDFYGVGYPGDVAIVSFIVESGQAIPYWRLPVEATLTIMEEGEAIWSYTGFLASPDWSYGNRGLFPEAADFWMSSNWTYSVDPSRYDEDYTASSRGYYQPQGPRGRWGDLKIERCANHQVILDLRVFGPIPDDLVVRVRLNNTAK